MILELCIQQVLNLSDNISNRFESCPLHHIFLVATRLMHYTQRFLCYLIRLLLKTEVLEIMVWWIKGVKKDEFLRSLGSK